MRHWTKTEENYLLENYYILPMSEIMQYLGRTNMAIRVKASELCLSKQKAWRTSELAFIKANYKSMSYAEIGKALNRSMHSISFRVIKLGLKKNNNNAT